MILLITLTLPSLEMTLKILSFTISRIKACKTFATHFPFLPERLYFVRSSHFQVFLRPKISNYFRGGFNVIMRSNNYDHLSGSFNYQQWKNAYKILPVSLYQLSNILLTHKGIHISIKMCARMFKKKKTVKKMSHFSPLYDRCTRGVVRVLP